MAEQTGMIEPFEPGQVKEVDGRKIVSYGTSSYGYDIRCSKEFKLFTNINSTIVDPMPAKIYANEGVAQELFFESDEMCDTSYRDRGGKYQGQEGVTLPKM